MSVFYDDYDKKCPDLIVRILEYFDINNTLKSINDKSVLDFCMQFSIKGVLPFQPQIVNRMCRKLCESGRLDCIRSMGGMGEKDNYICNILDKTAFGINRDRYVLFLNSIVYGFEYIYCFYKDLVVPLVWEKGNGDYSVGTGFKYKDGIVTAKHCVEDVTNLQIRGYTLDELSGSLIYISENDGVDLAFICTGKSEENRIIIDEGKVLQEVLVLGYPKIPAFTDFLTAEKATISSKASSRITPTKGSIAAKGYEYLTKTDAFLVTARIRGGNSGGPVINEYGGLVGIACQIVDASPENGDYDDLGYGVVLPVDYLVEITEKKNRVLSVPDNFFRNFVE